MSDPAHCVICRQPAPSFLSAQQVNGTNCPRCGRYEIAPDAVMALVAKSPERILPLADQTRAANARNEILLVTSSHIGNL
jgi:hypothetical protein